MSLSESTSPTILSGHSLDGRGSGRLAKKLAKHGTSGRVAMRTIERQLEQVLQTTSHSPATKPSAGIELPRRSITTRCSITSPG
jgi:hypothetical protein